MQARLKLAMRRLQLLMGTLELGKLGARARMLATLILVLLRQLFTLALPRLGKHGVARRVLFNLFALYEQVAFELLDLLRVDELVFALIALAARSN